MTSGRAPSERRHVRSKPALLPPAQRPPGLSIARRSLQDRLVDVGDVLDVAYPPAGGLQVADEHIEQEKRPGMAEMDRIVGGDTAHVQGHRPPVSLEGEPTPSPRLVEGQHDDRSPSTRRPHPPVALSTCTSFSLRPPRDASSISHPSGRGRGKRPRPRARSPERRVLVPLYVGHYGPENFLWFWNLDFLGRLFTGRHLLGLADYIFDLDKSLLLRGLYLFRVLLLILLLWMLGWETIRERSRRKQLSERFFSSSPMRTRILRKTSTEYLVLAQSHSVEFRQLSTSGP
jgi:hypothetical protein